MGNYRISVYLFDAERPVAVDDIEVVADALMSKYKDQVFHADSDNVKFLITASEIELPDSIEEFVEAISGDSFAILTPNVKPPEELA